MFAIIPNRSLGVELFESWTKWYGNGTIGLNDHAKAAKSDTNGNVYVIGKSGDVSVLAKYSPNGQLLWTNVFSAGNGQGGEAVALVVDRVGDVVVTGGTWVFQDSLHEYIAGLLTVKFSSSGAPVWTNYTQSSFDNRIGAKAIASDSDNSIVVAGFERTFDPVVFSPAEASACLVLKYSSAGQIQWVQRCQSTDPFTSPTAIYDEATAIDIDSEGNVLVAGFTADSSRLAPVISNKDWLILKFTATGTPVWTNVFVQNPSLIDEALDIASDSAGNVVVAGGGESSRFQIIKYSSSGALSWQRDNCAPASCSIWGYAKDIEVLASGDIIATGVIGSDYFTVKCSPTGTVIWTNWYNGPAIWDSATALTVDQHGAVYVTGESQGTSSGNDILTIKIGTNGVSIWTNRFNGSFNSNDSPVAVTKSLTDGSVIVVGKTFGGSSREDIVAISYSTNGAVLWTNIFNGGIENVDDRAQEVAVDQSGNIYVTGISASGSFNYYDFATVKYSPVGVALWTNRYDGPTREDDRPKSIALDSAGNCFVAGDSGGIPDMAIIKYSPSGVPLWTNRFNGPGNASDRCKGIKADASGNIAVAVDSAGDIVVIKYSNLGIALWTNRFNGSANSTDSASAIAVDSSGNVVVTGSAQRLGSGSDFVTFKYSPSGLPLWTNYFNGIANASDLAISLAIDSNGQVFVTGMSDSGSLNYDYVTIAYSSSGIPLWTAPYALSPQVRRDEPVQVVVDPSGSVLVTGLSESGPPWKYQWATIKYSNLGLPLWTNHFSLDNNSAVPRAITVGTNGNVFVVGYAIPSGSGYSEAAMVVYSPGGAPLSTTFFSSASGIDEATTIALDGSNAVIVAGFSDIGPGQDRCDFFVAKYFPVDVQFQYFPLKLASPTNGHIGTAYSRDRWTFFERSGRITIHLEAGGTNILQPRLGLAEISLFGPQTNLILRATNSMPDEPITIENVALFQDGVYFVQVRASPTEPTLTGNYQLTVYDTTLTTTPLVLNQTHFGIVSSQYDAELWTFSGVAGQQVRFDFLNSSGPGVAFALKGPSGWTGFSNLTGDSGLINLPANGAYTVVAGGLPGVQNITYAFQLQETLQTDLPLGTNFIGQFSGSGQARIFRIALTNNWPVRISLTNNGAGNRTELYVSQNGSPTRGIYDFNATEGNNASRELFIPSGTASNWYVLVYGDHIPTPGQYSIEVQTAPVYITSVGPAMLDQSDDQQVAILGLGFDDTTLVRFLRTNAPPLLLTQLDVLSERLLVAHLNLSNAPLGWLTLEVTRAGGVVTGSNVIQVVEKITPGIFQAKLIRPSAVGINATATFWINYTNAGGAATKPPLLRIKMPGARLRLEPNGPEADLFTIMAEGNTIPGLLLPGEHITKPIYYRGLVDRNLNNIRLGLSSLGGESSPNVIGWTSFVNQVSSPIPTEAQVFMTSSIADFLGDDWTEFYTSVSTLGRINNSRFEDSVGGALRLAAVFGGTVNTPSKPVTSGPVIMNNSDITFGPLSSGEIFNDPASPTKTIFVIKGWRDGAVDSQTAQALALREPNARIIAVDWASAANSYPLSKAAINSITVAEEISNYIKATYVNTDPNQVINPNQVTVVGHSLGGAIGGHMAKALGEPLDSIYAADTPELLSNIDRNSAAVVTTIKTTAAGLKEKGHVNFEVDLTGDFETRHTASWSLLFQSILNPAMTAEGNPFGYNASQSGSFKWDLRAGPQPRMVDEETFLDNVENLMYEKMNEECEPVEEVEVPVQRAFDPNDKLTTSGVGVENFLHGQDDIPYRIRFENIGPGSIDPHVQGPFPTNKWAAVPAQKVIITDQLSALMDWKTFRVTECGFGETIIAAPAGSIHFETTIPVTNDDLGFNVHVTADINLSNGLVTAVFQSIDPVTSLPPDVLTGFLPPEDGAGAGKGHFAFTVQPTSSLETGDEIRNVALISFDGQQTIATDQIDPFDPSVGVDPNKQALVTIDATAPESAVLTLPSESGRSFMVHWSGTDIGSGVASYKLHVSTNGGPFGLWQQSTNASSGVFQGELGKTYAFYSVAADNVGNIEAAPFVPDAQTMVVSNAPTLAAIADTTAQPGSALHVTNLVVSGTALGSFIYSLLGPPGGASINETNGVLTWTPNCSQGNTTNLVSVWVTDSGRTNISDMVSFLVAVEKCVEPSLGQVVLLAGASGKVPINLISKAALTNLQATLVSPPGRLVDFNLEAVITNIATVSVTSLTNLMHRLELATGTNQFLSGTQQVAWLHFTAADLASAFVPISLTNLSGFESNGIPVANFAPQSGRVVVLSDEPLLESVHNTNGQPLILLYGKPAPGYSIETKTNVLSLNWQTVITNLTMTNLLKEITPPASASPLNFFRAKREGSITPARLRGAMLTQHTNVVFLVRGLANRTYGIQMSPGLTTTNWQTIGSVTCDRDGIAPFTNNFPPTLKERYFRTVTAD